MQKKRPATRRRKATKTSASSETIVLAEDLELASAAGLQAEWRKLTDKKCNLTIDGTQVRVIDTAILQLLVVLLREAREKKLCVNWSQVSEVLRDSAALLGLADMLDLGPAET